MWCPSCNGKGYTTNYLGQAMKCLLCQGKGYLEEEQ